MQNRLLTKELIDARANLEKDLKNLETIDKGLENMDKDHLKIINKEIEQLRMNILDNEYFDFIYDFSLVLSDLNKFKNHTYAKRHLRYD